jgi:predicted TPR repeat methyltransferase
MLVNSAVKGPVLDLYCGTGLNAITAREAIGGTWIGVEPVAAWGALCAERGLYDRFEHADPLNFLTQSRGCAVVLLNEAFAQVAEARPLLGALRAALATEGLALAAIPSGAGLTGHGLFGHDAAEIAELAGRCGLSFTVLREGVLRYAEGIPVRGIVVRFSQE